ncbi:PREDICTED: uncharacterized protein LOC104817486 [Tarenaya hassleriana]|uniref:uncharacterized protein LOC104817486 n=1 Tax=Tarenaya hassleriana TaxID=28532 RepID=UPI00053C18D5|nr:PREDICTED: uncharacterized protein LOC104817486 [Tarenaya hassleriana]
MSLLSFVTATAVFFFSFFSSISPAISSPVVSGDIRTAYDLLQSYNFPVGVLPKGVIRYDLDKSTGRFHVFWNDSCSFSLEGSYQLRYKSSISGQISNNRLTNLSGVSVKVLFLWLNIVEVTRNGDDLEFSVGIASAGFPIDNFYVCPQCGCGLICDDPQVRKMRRSPFVSSI